MRIKRSILLAASVLGLVTTGTAGVLKMKPAQTSFLLNPAGEGRRVYLSHNCYGCHGGRAGGGMGPSFRREAPEYGDLSEAVLEGEDRGMPAYRNVSATDITNLSAYFKTLGTSSEPTFTRWWEATPSQ